MIQRTLMIKRILVGVTTATLTSLALMVLLALGVMYLQPSDGAITTCNQIIKLVSLFFGVLCGVKPGGKQGFLLGAATGLIYMALGYGLYCALGEAMPTFGLIAIELLMGTLIGALAGALVANLPSRRRR